MAKHIVTQEELSVKESLPGMSDEATSYTLKEDKSSPSPFAMSDGKHSAMTGYGELICTLLLMDKEAQVLHEIDCYVNALVWNGMMRPLKSDETIQDYVIELRNDGWLVEVKVT